MKKRITFIAACVILTLCACGGGDVPAGNTAGEYRRITAEQARKMMEETAEFILLDVRTEEEYAEIRIEDAILIPDYEIAERAAAELPDQNALILIYCRSGRRSVDAARELIDMGYTNVYDFGGIIDWPYDAISIIEG